MNKILLLISILFFQFHSNSQTDLYSKLKQLIHEKHPELSLENKLIGCVVWSIKQEESRNQNKSFDKSMHVYENAKLRGGSKGIIILSVNKEDLSSEANIIFQKDEIVELIPVKLLELEGIDLSTLQNVVYDSTGLEVYRDLNSTMIYSSINKLITR